VPDGKREPIDVLYFIDNLDSGGTQRQLTLLLSNLDPSTVRATLCTYQPERDFFARRINPGSVRLVEIPKKGKMAPGFAIRLVRFIRRERFDLIHSFLRSSNFWGCLGGRLAGSTRILASERRANFGETLIDAIVSPIVLRMAHHVATNSRVANERLVRAFGIPEEKTTVIYNGIPTIDAEGEPPATGVILSMAATFAPNKNQRCVVEAFMQAYAQLPQPAVLQLMGNEGDGRMRRELEGLIRGRPCESAVRFLGRRSDVLGLFSRSHGVVLASFNEAFPNVLLESMLCGCPVLASNVCENPWIVGERGERGWLFDPHRPDELAAAMVELARMQPEARARIGTACRHWVRDNFSAEKMVSETVQLYRRLLGRA
jgi:glycosyltransferase involved in cell wall biosynthesis